MTPSERLAELEWALDRRPDIDSDCVTLDKAHVSWLLQRAKLVDKLAGLIPDVFEFHAAENDCGGDEDCLWCVDAKDILDQLQQIDTPPDESEGEK